MRNGQGLAGKTAIIGVGETTYGKRGALGDRTELELCIEAIQRAADDAGLPIEEIDGFTSFGFERHEPVVIQAALGIPELRHSSIVWGGGGGGSTAAVMTAATAVAAGLCRNAIVYRSICQGQYERYGQFRNRPTFGSFISPFGLMSPAQMTALTTQRHMYLYGTNRDHLAEVAITFRRHAQRNPRAIMHGRLLDRDTYFAARMIADPFHLFDCCLETDGACAVLISSVERAGDLRQPVVKLLACAQASGPGWSLGPMGTHNMPIDDYATINSKPVGRLVFEQAGLTPADIDVAQLYDAFTGLIPMALEDYGFCERGEGGPFIAAGNLSWPDGGLPSNTSGGLLSEAYLHGMNLVIEGVRQMRGTSTCQVEGAKTCLVTSGGGGGHKSAAILGR
jgi:acetyl-CoA acetyltransferase